jgi:hypothetical protein
MYKLLPHKLDSSKVTIEASIRANELWRATCFEALSQKLRCFGKDEISNFYN